MSERSEAVRGLVAVQSSNVARAEALGWTDTSRLGDIDSGAAFHRYMASIAPLSDADALPLVAKALRDAQNIRRLLFGEAKRVLGVRASPCWA